MATRISRRIQWRWIVVALILIAAVGCYESLDDASEPSRSNGSTSLDTWWSNRTQVQRNAPIVARGLQQLGQVTGQQCKEWVRTVVYSASQNDVLLPPNQSNGWQWHSHPKVRLVAQNVCPANLQPGHIVQLRQANGMSHTAIVRTVSQAGMTWLDANWVNYNNPAGTVASHAISWASFYSLASQYSFYEITG